MIILKGQVHGEIVYRNKPVIIDPIEAPQLIAPAFLFGGYNKLPIDVIADGEVTILTLHRGYLFELMQNNVLILSNFIDIISDRANVWVEKDLLLFVPFAQGEGGQLSARIDYRRTQHPYGNGSFARWPPILT